MDELKTNTDELELRRLIRMVWSRKWLVLGCVLLVGGAAFGGSKLQSAVYEARASLKVQQKATEDPFDQSGGRIDPLSQDRNVKTEIRVLESQPIEDIVTSQIGKEGPSVSGSQEAQTNVMVAAVSSTDKELATKAANAYAAAYIDFRKTQAINDVLAAAKQVDAKVQEIQAQVDAVDAEINRVTGQDAARLAKDPRALPSPELALLRSQRATIASQQLLFRQKLDQLQVAQSLETGGAQLVEEATPPDGPISPKPIRNTGLGALLGLLLGLGLVFLLDRLDDDRRGK